MKVECEEKMAFVWYSFWILNSFARIKSALCVVVTIVYCVGIRRKQLSSQVKQAFPLDNKTKQAVFLTLSVSMQYIASVAQGKRYLNSEICKCFAFALAC